MNKFELVNAVSSKANFSKKDTEAFVDAFIDCVSDTLERGEKIQLVGFGSFEVVHRASRVCRNPQTGKPMEIPAQRAVKFKSGKLLKERVSNAEDTE